jgi:hypothetical protein
MNTRLRASLIHLKPCQACIIEFVSAIFTHLLDILYLQVKCQLSYCSLHANILALISVHSGPSNREDQLAPAAGAAAQICRINLKVMTVMKPCDMIQNSSGATQFYFILSVYLGCFFS